MRLKATHLPNSYYTPAIAMVRSNPRLSPRAPALGCSRTHSAVTLGDWSDPLDPDAEAQTVYKQLLQGRDKLRSARFSFLAGRLR